MRAALAVAIALSALARGAEAHQFPVERRLYLEPTGKDALAVLVHLKVPRGKQRDALLGGADVDRDGRLGAPEAKRIEAQMLERALDGLRLLVDTATVALVDPKVELKLGSLAEPTTELMVIGTVPLPPRPVRVEVKTSAFGDKLVVELLPGSRSSPARPTAELGLSARAVFPLTEARER